MIIYNDLFLMTRIQKEGESALKRTLLLLCCSFKLLDTVYSLTHLRILGPLVLSMSLLVLEMMTSPEHSITVNRAIPCQ